LVAWALGQKPFERAQDLLGAGSLTSALDPGYDEFCLGCRFGDAHPSAFGFLKIRPGEDALFETVGLAMG
jgi:hypothetical protein